MCRMTAQLAFDLEPLAEVTYTPESTIQQRFEQWSDANPWVLVALESLVADWLRAGHQRVGIKQCWEVIRWQYGATTGDTFKANNDFTSRAARVLLDRHPEWESAIETRGLRAA